MSGRVENRTKRSHVASDLREAIALDAERRPPSFSRQGHGHQPCACPCQVSGTVRPRPRAGSEPSTCGMPSIPRARWCAGRCAARRRPERLQSFGTIMLVLAMPLQLAPSTKQVLAYTARSPCATTTQPTHRLLCVHGRRPSGAALEAVHCGCQAAARGSSVVARRSSRRPPCPCLGVRRGPGRPAHEVRTAAGRRAS